MGGPGSGALYYHWWRPSKKTVVEDCLSLDANGWTHEGMLRASVLATGSWRWTYRSGKSFSVGYTVDTTDQAGPFVRLFYSWTWPTSPEPQSADYRVRLTTTRPRFGGLRWWFVCPLVVNGRPCNRRVGKLYLPPPARYFGCRPCHELTYTSCQEHDKRVDALRRNPELLGALLENLEGAPPGHLILALKATHPIRGDGAAAAGRAAGAGDSASGRRGAAADTAGFVRTSVVRSGQES